MAKKKEVFLSPHGDKWSVKKAKAKRPSRVFGKKSDAMEYAKNLAKKNKSEFISQKKNGRINVKNSYGHDPKNEKG